jgi:UDP-N-acetylmuramyl pentapeptide synthase
MRILPRSWVLELLWGAVARRHRAESPYVIAVTGSVGKTSTKEALATILHESGKRVVKTEGNLATDSGIPLSLMGYGQKVAGRRAQLAVAWRALTMRFPVAKEPVYWVLEYSSDAPGDLAFLAKHVAPNVVVITSGGPVHLEYYKAQEAVVAELHSLVDYLLPEGYVVLNGDDPFLSTLTWPKDTIRYGMAGLTTRKAAVEVRAEMAALHAKGMSLRITDAQQKVAETVEVAVIGKQQAVSVVAAVAVAQREGLTWKQIRKGVTSYQIPPGRGRLIPGVKGTTLIDDSANASPEAAVAGVAMLRPWAKGRRTVAVLGTMGELGAEAEEAHREVGRAAAKTVDFLVAIGQYAKTMTAAAQEAGLPSHRMLAFDTPEHLASQLDQVVERGDIIYVKASQNGMRLERLVKQLMADPSQAATLLVRQTSAWRSKS